MGELEVIHEEAVLLKAEAPIQYWGWSPTFQDPPFMGRILVEVEEVRGSGPDGRTAVSKTASPGSSPGCPANQFGFQGDQ
jgi:hypothetical protein